MECAQLNITRGQGTAVPKNTVSFPGAYKANDPGLLISIYTMTPATKYVIPGPAKFTCAASGTGAAPATTLATKVLSPTPEPEPVEAEPAEVDPVEESPACAAVAQYGQCGGSSFAGCSACVEGRTCSKINEYYSQCV
jgi:cellulase